MQDFLCGNAEAMSCDMIYSGKCEIKTLCLGVAKIVIFIDKSHQNSSFSSYLHNFISSLLFSIFKSS